MKVEFNNLKAQWDLVKNPCLSKIKSLFDNSDFILGNSVFEFENSFSNYVGCEYSVGTSNGTDALKLATQSLGLHSESTLVIIPANTFIATILGVEQALPSSKFMLIDCNEYHQIDTFLLEKILSEHRKFFHNCVIVPVHLYGYTCDMDHIKKIANTYDCAIIEDSSQAHGAKYKGKMVGTFGNASAFSLYPGKNLGAAGDAGIITTNSEDTSNKLKLLRNLGADKKYHHEIKAGNHRLDTIQAIVLLEKLKFLDKWNQSRRDVVQRYENGISNPKVKLPITPEYCIPVHHVYPVTVDNRNNFQQFLSLNGIQNMVHYPIGIGDTPMYQHIKLPNSKSKFYNDTMVSIPIHPFLEEKQIDHIISTINKY